MRKPMLPWLVAGLVLALGLVNPQDAGASDKMYWTDDITAKIQRANLDGSSVEDLVTTGLSGPFGIALDLPSPAPVPALGRWGTVLLCAALAALLLRSRRSSVS